MSDKNLYASSCLTDDRDAEARHIKYRLEDPYPKIPPTLLNFDDILKYVHTTGMICPFLPNEKNLKHASFGVRLIGKCVSWDDEGIKVEKDIREGDELILKRRSILWVTIEPRFRIPYYIALRFNLKITHIHRGILLGTGPLVDPGFDGYLAIPLHNLTMNDYVLRGGDDLIWVEFTKISCHYDEKDGVLAHVKFPVQKNIKNINDYLYKAYHLNPIRSSLSEIMNLANSASKKVNMLTWGVIGGGVIAAISIILALILPTYSLVTDATNYVKAAEQSNQAKISELENRLEKRIGEIERASNKGKDSAKAAPKSKDKNKSANDEK